MQSKKLGKGLGELLGEIESSSESTNSNDMLFINIQDITLNPYQPRKYFDEFKLQELADSIKEHGLLQPVLLVKSDDDFVLIAGERRLRATKLNGYEKIKAIVLDYELDYIKELSLIENIQREDLNAIEIANSYSELIREYQITHDQLAKKVKKSRSSITNTIRLLQLPDWIQEKISNSELSAGQSKVLIGLDENDQRDLVEMIIKEKMPSSKVEKIVKNIKQIPTNKTEKKLSGSIDEKIASANKILNTKDIKSSVLDNKLIVSFSNDKQIDEFLKLIK